MYVLLLIAMMKDHPPTIVTQEFSSYATCDEAGKFFWRQSLNGYLRNSAPVKLLYTCEQK